MHRWQLRARSTEARRSGPHGRAAPKSVWAPVLLVGSLSTAVAITGCASTANAPRGTPAETLASVCPAPLQPYLRAALYMSGRNTDGAPDERWDSLVNEVLIPHFPDGGSVIETTGWWQRRDGRAGTSAGRMIVILHPLSDRDSFVAAVEAVIEAIKVRFNHRAVLWEEARVCATF